jgi:hypothetical protein
MTRPKSLAHLSNRHNLRIVKMVDNVAKLDEAVTNGHITLVRGIKRNPKLCSNRLLLRNFEDGRYEDVSGRTVMTRDRLIKFPESEWELIHSYEKYHRTRSGNQNWAAYVLPLAPSVQERFYIEDIIEDILVQRFWEGWIVADDGEAIWNGHDLEIDHKLYEDFRIVG